MVRRLFETGQLEHAVAHLAEAEARDAEHFALVRHDVREQLHVPRVNVHGAHDEADFVDDGLARRFDAEHVAHFHDRIGPRRQSVYPFRRHAVAEAVAFDQDCVLAEVVSLDDGAGCFGVSANGDVGQDALDCLQTEMEVRVFFRGGFEGSALGATGGLF